MELAARALLDRRKSDAARIRQPAHVLDQRTVPVGCHLRKRQRGGWVALLGMLHEALHVLDAKHPDRVFGSVQVQPAAFGDDGKVLAIGRKLDHSTRRSPPGIFEQRQPDVVLGCKRPLAKGGGGQESGNHKYKDSTEFRNMCARVAPEERAIPSPPGHVDAIRNGEGRLRWLQTSLTYVLDAAKAASEIERRRQIQSIPPVIAPVLKKEKGAH